MTTGPYGPYVRIVAKPNVSTFPSSTDLHVQVLRPLVLEDRKVYAWETVANGIFNDLEDDHAHTHSMQKALSCRRKLFEGEQP